jgi:hypothetical protein
LHRGSLAPWDPQGWGEISVQTLSAYDRAIRFHLRNPSSVTPLKRKLYTSYGRNRRPLLEIPELRSNSGRAELRIHASETNGTR